MPFFYVLYIHDSPLSDYLEAIRFLADPGEKAAAHITVRGPYLRAISLKHIQKSLVGERIAISSVGNFFSDGQKTVFWNCSSPRLESVWKKKDFGFHPHITAYDGLSLHFARDLYEVMRQYPYELQFEARQLQIYSSRKRQTGFQLQLFYNENLICRILNRDLTARQITRLSPRKRLYYIDRICKYISRHSLSEKPAQLLFA